MNHRLSARARFEHSWEITGTPLEELGYFSPSLPFTVADEMEYSAVKRCQGMAGYFSGYSYYLTEKINLLF